MLCPVYSGVTWGHCRLSAGKLRRFLNNEVEIRNEGNTGGSGYVVKLEETDIISTGIGKECRGGFVKEAKAGVVVL